MTKDTEGPQLTAQQVEVIREGWQVFADAFKNLWREMEPAMKTLAVIAAHLEEAEKERAALAADPNHAHSWEYDPEDIIWWCACGQETTQP